MKTWFTSDEHFWHTNIIKYQNRPFKSIEEMNETMIRNWQELVMPDDVVFCIGDFAFCEKEEAQKIMDRLPGHKHLILGNHDRKKNLAHGWDSISELRQIKINNDSIVLCHYSLRVWDKSHHGSYNLYGHSHGHLPGTTQSCDVGVDCWDFKPVTFDTIKKRMKSQKDFRQEDYHGVEK